MSISYQFGDVDAHGAMIRSQAASLEAEHQSIVRDVLAAGDFWGGSGSVACQEFITQLGRNFQTIYEQANSHGQKVQTAGNNMSQHRLRRRRQLGLTPKHVLWPAHPMGVRATTISTAIQPLGDIREPLATPSNSVQHTSHRIIETVGVALKSLPRNDIWLPRL